MLAGLTIGFLVILRLVWGFTGTTYARFSSFKLQPLELLQYLRDAVFSTTKRYLGHNPASSYAAVVMFICAIGLAATGILMTGGNGGDISEELHEIFANLFLITVIAHVGGIIFHQFKHKDALWSSMLDGKKHLLPGKAGIKNSRRMAGVVFLMLALVWTGYLYTNYDRTTKTLDLFGSELSLGEEEHEEHATFDDEYHEQEDD